MKKTMFECLTCYEEIINGIRKYDKVFTTPELDLLTLAQHGEEEHKGEPELKYLVKQYEDDGGILVSTFQILDTDLEKYASMKRYCGLEYVKDLFSVLGEVEDNIIVEEEGKG